MGSQDSSQVGTQSTKIPREGFITHAANTPSKISRDEMNLAEFPLTVLSTRAEPNIKTLEFSDSIRGKNGEVVNRQWIITAADKFGLPTCSDDEVLLGLLKLTVDEGFKNQKVYFSRYELLRILRWTTEGRSYSRLQKALDRLSGVRIKATNAFFDNDSKSHSTRNFGLVDAYEINDGRTSEAKPSFFIWSEVLFKSFQVGFIKKFDLDFYLELESAVSKRLYRFLDKHFWYRSKIQINLFTLAHEKIGISRNYKYASSLRQQLDPAAEELVSAGFLDSFDYVGKGSATEIILYAGRGKPRVLDGQKEEQGTDKVSRTINKNLSSSEQRAPQEHLQFGEDDNSSDSRQRTILVAKLHERGIKEEQARRLIAQKEKQDLEKIALIINYFDSLLATQSKLVSRSPVGFLFRAVEKSHDFVLPHTVQGAGKNKQQAPQKAPPSFGNKQKSDPLRDEYDRFRRAQLELLWETTEQSLIQKLHIDAEKTLARIREIISEEGFRQTVTHKVEETLCSLFAIPNFDEWSKKRRV